MKKLELGVAYHDNRILKSIKEDMQDIVRHNMNLVVHVFTHNDIRRHKGIMKDVFAATRDAGLDFWVDNFGLSGPPNAPNHITQFYPGTNRVYSNGDIDPWNVCYTAPGLMEITKLWVDTVGEIGGKKLFWDEPHLESYETGIFACRCERCQNLFYEKYGYEMPEILTPDVEKFRMDSMTDYFTKATKYAADNGMENIVCLMPSSLGFTDAIIDIPYVHNMGTDPYWFGTEHEPFSYVYNSSKKFIDKTERHNKNNHIWIQSYRVPEGRENEIYLAADAAYDAGARTILAWSFRGGEGCDYRAERCDMVWHTTGEAMRRLRDRYQDDMLNEARKGLK